MWVELVVGVTLFCSRGTLVHPPCQNQHSGKWVLQQMFRQRHLVDHMFIFSSGNCQMSPSLKKVRQFAFLFNLAASVASGSLVLSNSQATDILKN